MPLAILIFFCTVPKYFIIKCLVSTCIYFMYKLYTVLGPISRYTGYSVCMSVCVCAYLPISQYFGIDVNPG